MKSTCKKREGASQMRSHIGKMFPIVNIREIHVCEKQHVVHAVIDEEISTILYVRRRKDACTEMHMRRSEVPAQRNDCMADRMMLFRNT